MTLTEAADLLPPALPAGAPAVWADLGCGSGLFTLALARLLPPGSTIWAIDTQPGIAAQTTAGGISIQPCRADFVKDPLPFAAADGFLMANALHYVADKTAFLQKLIPLLRRAGSFLIVEYDTDTPVPRWVPYPLSSPNLVKLFAAEGFGRAEALGVRPSVFGRSNLYSMHLQR